MPRFIVYVRSDLNPARTSDTQEEEVTLLLPQQFLEMEPDRCSRIFQMMSGKAPTGPRRARPDEKLCAVPTSAF
jgi:hypothetical protein